MDDKVWNEGEPPHIGWWNAVRGDINDAPNPSPWRWWDGNHWSYGAYAGTSGGAAYVSATASWQKNEGVVWSDYYPEGARVPRVDPTLRANIGIVNAINMTAKSEGSADWWAGKAWEFYNQRYAPLPTAVKDDWSKWATTPQRLSDAVRVGDVDFSGALLRNSVCVATQDHRREDTPGSNKQHLRSNGQAQNPERREIGDPFHGISTMALMKELFRRFNATP